MDSSVQKEKFRQHRGANLPREKSNEIIDLIAEQLHVSSADIPTLISAADELKDRLDWDKVALRTGLSKTLCRKHFNEVIRPRHENSGSCMIPNDKLDFNSFIIDLLYRRIYPTTSHLMEFKPSSGNIYNHVVIRRCFHNLKKSKFFLKIYEDIGYSFNDIQANAGKQKDGAPLLPDYRNKPSEGLDILASLRALPRKSELSSRSEKNTDSTTPDDDQPRTTATSASSSTKPATKAPANVKHPSYSNPTQMPDFDFASAYPADFASFDPQGISLAPDEYQLSEFNHLLYLPQTYLPTAMGGEQPPPSGDPTADTAASPKPPPDVTQQPSIDSLAASLRNLDPDSYAPLSAVPGQQTSHSNDYIMDASAPPSARHPGEAESNPDEQACFASKPVQGDHAFDLLNYSTAYSFDPLSMQPAALSTKVQQPRAAAPAGSALLGQKNSSLLSFDLQSGKSAHGAGQPPFPELASSAVTHSAPPTSGRIIKRFKPNTDRALNIKTTTIPQNCIASGTHTQSLDSSMHNTLQAIMNFQQVDPQEESSVASVCQTPGLYSDLFTPAGHPLVGYTEDFLKPVGGFAGSSVDTGLVNIMSPLVHHLHGPLIGPLNLIEDAGNTTATCDAALLHSGTIAFQQQPIKTDSDCSPVLDSDQNINE